MKKHLLSLFFLCLAFMGEAQTIFENFEFGYSDLPWAASNGAIFSGAIVNPDNSPTNTSGFVGSVTNVAPNDFGFLITDLPEVVDLSVSNLISMRVWAPIAPCQVLFKFEGGGAQIEKFKTINVANQWVVLTFDLSAGASLTTLNKCLIAFNPFTVAAGETFYFDDIRSQQAEQCYETFEGDIGLPWAAIDGEFVAPVANPTPNSLNSTANCGQYTKSGTTGYSLLLADNLNAAFDLSVLNQFKMDVYATVPSQVLFKLEGIGQSIEVIKNIGVTNAWQTYTFDLSAAATVTGFTKIVLFFDPGSDTTTNTYLFDNICAIAKGDCEGITPVANLIDDFECNRNAIYVNGWDSLSVIANPDPSGINTSAKVGQYIDPLAESYAALLIDYQNAMDLSVFNQFKVKVWSPGTSQILFKLEGGTSPAVELIQTIPTANAWVEYTVDFSAQAAANHKKIVMFFNPGQDPQPGDIYYIDDLRWAEQESNVIEDFEGGAFLPWQPLDGVTTLHGTFAVASNPNISGINTSAEVGKYIKGSSPFSTVEAVAPGVIDISSQPQYNLDILAPAGATTVTMQIESPTAGNAEVTRDLNTPGVWENVSFDFSDNQTTNNWVAMRLLFKPGTAEGGTIYYYDNLSQSSSTVNPCEGVVAIPNIIDDYECQRNYAYGAGANLLSVVDNPDVTTTNSSTKVGLYLDQPNEPFQALCAEIPAGIDLSVFNQLAFLVKGPAVPILCKLEGGSSPGVEIFTASTLANEWEKINVDFSAQAGQDHKRVCLFLNGGVGQTTEDTYYIDNLRFARAPYDACIINFETPAFDAVEWKYFPGEASGAFEAIANPDPTGLNTSAKVGKATEKATGEQPWQGMFTNLPAPIKFGPNKLVKMMVWSPQVATVTMKIENPANPAAPATSGDNTIANTVANQWEELTWDFSASPTPLPDDGDYQRVTLIWDVNNIPAADVIYYFDNIGLDGAMCFTTGTNNLPEVQALKVMPNPVQDLLLVQQLGTTARLEVRDLMGRSIANVAVGNDTETAFNTRQFAAGVYFLTGYNAMGQLVSHAKFIKL